MLGLYIRIVYALIMNSETLFSNMKATNSKLSLSLCDVSVVLLSI